MSAATGPFQDEMIRRGISDVISKPFDLNDLRAKVREMCPPDGRAA